MKDHGDISFIRLLEGRICLVCIKALLVGACFINILVSFNNTEQIKVANLPCMDIAVWSSERTRSS